MYKPRSYPKTSQIRNWNAVIESHTTFGELSLFVALLRQKVCLKYLYLPIDGLNEVLARKVMRGR